MSESGWNWLRSLRKARRGPGRSARTTRRWGERDGMDALEQRNLMAVVTTLQVTEGAVGETVIPLRVTIPGPITMPLTYNVSAGGGIATKGDDYEVELDGSSFTINPGDDSTKILNVTIKDDMLIEHNENFFVVVSGHGRAAITQVIILDDDGLGPQPRMPHTIIVKEGPKPLPFRPGNPDRLGPDRLTPPERPVGFPLALARLARARGLR